VTTTTYLLEVGARGADRLALIHDIYGPTSWRVLSQVDLRGARVLELGCGTGAMTRFLAKEVGPNGHVVGVDSSEAQLSAARASGPLANVEWVRANAIETDLPHGDFDLVYLRLLLMHVPEPLSVLLHAHDLLREGGIIVCEEAAVDSTFTDPPVPEQGELHALANQMARGRGCDFNVARRLSSLVRAAGFGQLETSAHQPVYASGPEKQLEVASFAEALSHWRDAPANTQARGQAIVDTLRSAALDDECTYGLSMMMQVRARKPGR
jgi:ubiquinone/menaquinone biosynthesis C-methylase UbiE